MIERMDEIPTIEPTLRHSDRTNILSMVFRLWPLNRLQVNPVYRLTILVIMKVLGLLTVFQVALILGAPLGQAAWGGQYTVLPPSLRIGSGISIIIYFLILKIALDRASLSSQRVFRRRTSYFTNLIAAYFSCGVILNLMSGSHWEKYIMAPIALILALCFFYLARTPKITEEMVHVNS